MDADSSCRILRIDPRIVKYSENIIGELIHPDVPVIPWQDKHPHTLPLNVIKLDNNSGYLTYDNRRLYSALKSGLIINPDLKIDIVVHEHTEQPILNNLEITDIAWSSDDGIFVLSLQCMTWFSSITMQCAKQAPSFPLEGSSAEPVCQQSRLKLLEQFVMKNKIQMKVEQISLETWKEKLSTQQTIMVQKQQGFNVYHSRTDLSKYIIDFSDHFTPLSFIFRKHSIFDSRMKVVGVGIDSNCDGYDIEEKEVDVLMSEYDDMLEFDWIDQQLLV